MCVKKFYLRICGGIRLKMTWLAVGTANFTGNSFTKVERPPEIVVILTTIQRVTTLGARSSLHYQERSKRKREASSKIVIV